MCEPPYEKVTSVAVVPIDPIMGHVVAVNLKDRGLDLPGGHTQVNDLDPLETARRECAEEASIRVGTLVLIDVIQSDFYGPGEADLTYMLIYAADAAEMLPFEANEESAGRMLVRPSEFLEGYSGHDLDSMKQWLSSALKYMDLAWT